MTSAKKDDVLEVEDSEHNVLEVEDTDDDTVTTVDTTIVTTDKCDDEVVVSNEEAEKINKEVENETPKRANKNKLVKHKVLPKKSQQKDRKKTNQSKNKEKIMTSSEGTLKEKMIQCSVILYSRNSYILFKLISNNLLTIT